MTGLLIGVAMTLCETGVLFCAGHMWGSDVTPALERNTAGGKFDLVLLADVLWLHDKVCLLVSS